MCYAEGEYFDTTNPTVDNNGLPRDAYGKAVKIGTRHPFKIGYAVSDVSSATTVTTPPLEVTWKLSILFVSL